MLDTIFNVTLLMHYICVVKHQPDLTALMCSRLSSSAQVVIKELLVKLPKAVSRDALKQHLQTLPDMRPSDTPRLYQGCGGDDSPASCGSPLQEFFHTPNVRRRDSNRLVARLKQQLNEERYEKEEMQEELRVKQEKICKLEKELTSKSLQLSGVRQRIFLLENSSPPKSDKSQPAETGGKTLHGNCCDSNGQLEELRRTVEQLQGETELYASERKRLEEKCAQREKAAAEAETLCFRLNEDVSRREEELCAARDNCRELEALLEELRRERREGQLEDESFVGEAPENLGLCVVDVQLQESLKDRAALERLLDDVRGQLGTLQKENGDLRTEVRRLQQVQEEFLHEKNSSAEKSQRLQEELNEKDLELKNVAEQLRQTSRMHSEEVEAFETKTLHLEEEIAAEQRKIEDVEVVGAQKQQELHAEMAEMQKLHEESSQKMRETLGKCEEQLRESCQRLGGVLQEKEELRVSFEANLAERDANSVEREAESLRRAQKVEKEHRLVLIQVEEDKAALNRTVEDMKVQLMALQRELEAREVREMEKTCERRELRARIAELTEKEIERNDEAVRIFTEKVGMEEKIVELEQKLREEFERNLVEKGVLQEDFKKNLVEKETLEEEFKRNLLELGDKQRELSQLHQDFDVLQEKLKETLQEKEVSIERFEKNLLEKEEQRKMELGVKQKEILQLHEDLEDLEKKLKETLQEEVVLKEHFEKSLQEKETKLGEKQQEILQLHQDLEVSEEKLKETLQEKEVLQEEFKKNLVEKDVELGGEREESLQLRRDLEAVEEKLMKTVQEREEELVRISRENQVELEQRIAEKEEEMEAAVEEKRREIAEVREDLEALEEKLGKAVKELQEVRKSREELFRETETSILRAMEQAEAIKSGTELDLCKEKTLRAQKEAELAENEGKLRVLEEEHRVLADEHKVLEGKHQILEEKHKVLEDEHVILEEKRQSIEDERVEAFRTLVESRRCFVELLKAVDVVPGNDNLVFDDEKVMQDVAGKFRALQRQCEGLCEELGERNEAIAAMEVKVEGLEGRLAELEGVERELEEFERKRCKEMDDLVQKVEKEKPEMNGELEKCMLGEKDEENVANNKELLEDLVKKLEKEKLEMAKELDKLKFEANNKEVDRENVEKNKENVAKRDFLRARNKENVLKKNAAAANAAVVDVLKQKLFESEAAKQNLQQKLKLREAASKKNRQEEEKEVERLRASCGSLQAEKSVLQLKCDGLTAILKELREEEGQVKSRRRQLLKEDYDKLVEERSKCEAELDTVRFKRNRDREEYVRLLKREKETFEETLNRKVLEIRAEYELKLETMKGRMVDLYKEEVDKKMQHQGTGRAESGDKEKAFLEQVVQRQRQDLASLRRTHEQAVREHRELLLGLHASSRDSVASIASTRSLRTEVACPGVAVRRGSTLPRTLRLPKQEEADGASVRKRRIDVDAMEDEEGDGDLELFNNKYLEDMKRGRCSLVPTHRDRLSELQRRNTMCLPHLKSSYPAETQFVPPDAFREEDVKLGAIPEQQHLDDSTMSRAPLLPGAARRKDAGTTSYKKPGPPTPSKNGGRTSLQGPTDFHFPGRAATDPSADAKTPKGAKQSTPSRIRQLFMGKSTSGRDEATPKAKKERLSIFRRPR